MGPVKHGDRCCNPLNKPNHTKKKGLRPPSKRLCTTWNLGNMDRLCVDCRMELLYAEPPSTSVSNADDELANTDPPPAPAANSDDEHEEAQIDNDMNVEELYPQEILKSFASSGPSNVLSSLSSGATSSETLHATPLSINTRLPAMNDALGILDQSPIPKKKLSDESWIHKKVEKIATNLRSSLGVDCDAMANSSTRDLQDILDRLMKKYHDAATTNSEKIQILTILPSHWSAGEMAKAMGATKYMAKKAKELAECRGVLAMPDKKLGRAVSENTRTMVLAFYNDDRGTTLMPGMKDFVSVRTEENTRIHVQKRLILSSLKEFYEDYRTQYPEAKVGFSIFASLRPKHCVLAGGSGTHTVCVCSIHQNVKLMMIGANLKGLSEDAPHPLDDYRDCIKLVVCSNPSPNCYLGQCPDCPGTSVLHDLLETIFEENNISNVVYKNWVSTTRANLEEFIKKSDDFIDTFCETIQNLVPHNFIAKQQASFMKETKESLQANEFLAVCDYAENYAFVVQEAAPGFHWNNDAATVYPVVLYFRENEVINHRSLVIISNCLNHDATAVYAFSKVVIDFMRTLNKNATKVHYFSDGAPQQFKNWKYLLNLYHHKDDYGIDAEHHYFATAHGKGPCDGVGGTLKREAARASLQLPLDCQITKPEQLFEWADHPNHLPNITVKYCPQEQYDAAKEFLKSRFELGKTIPGTQKIHSVIPNVDGRLCVKPYSSSNNCTYPSIVKKKKL